jgi:acyl-lipid omega-6 desaturase (Delta-12 desaturase)
MIKPQASSFFKDHMTLEEVKALGLKLAAHCMDFRDVSVRRSLTQLFITLGLFFVSFTLAFLSLQVSYFLTLALSIPTGIFLVRLFIIQHDCGHGAFFKSMTANNYLGRFLSVFTVTPYEFWKRAHAIHHASCSNLERRGTGDISTLTIKEYNALPLSARVKYRLYRNPIVLFIIGVPVHFAIIQRIPFWQPLPAKKIWKSVVGLDIALVVVLGGAMYFLGVVPFLMVYLPALAVAAIVGGWMFFIQHQYEDTYWEHNEEWNFHLAGMLGSSYYVLPKILQWLTGNIGLHHIHHLNSAIPNYRLQECLDASPELLAIPKKIKFFESLKCAHLSLWDEDNRKLVSFARARTIAA